MRLLLSQQGKRPGLVRAPACGWGRAFGDPADSHDFTAAHGNEHVAAYADQDHQVSS